MASFLGAFGFDEVQQLQLNANLTRAGRVLGLHQCQRVNAEWFVVWLWNNQPGAVPASTARSASTRVICFGTARDDESHDCAQLVLDAFVDDGVAALHGLDASFGAVIIDEERRAVWVVSDITGHRRLSVADCKSSLLVSPHDLVLAASGAVQEELDLVTAASVLVHDWSIGSRSLLRDVRAVPPDQIWHWQPGCGTSKRTAEWVTPARLDTQDQTGIARVCEDMIELMQADASRYLRSRPRIRADLTAGSDSRCVAALLLSCVEPERIDFICAGEYEGKTAKRLASRLGATVQILGLGPAHDSTFTDNLSLLAFTMNGTANGKVAVGTPLRRAPGEYSKANGIGGGLYSGFYYSPLPRILDRLPERFVESIFARTDRSRGLPWDNLRLHEGACDRRRARFAALGRVNESPYDRFDLFCLAERWGIVGARPYRGSAGQHWSPFSNPALVQLWLKLPSPRADYARLNPRVVQTFSPQIYSIPINGTYLYSMYGPGMARSIARSAAYLSSVVAAKVAAKLARPALRNPGIDTLRGDVMRTHHAEEIRALLFARSSFSEFLLGVKGTRQFWESHFENGHDKTHMLGQLLVMERWRELLKSTLNVVDCVSTH